MGIGSSLLKGVVLRSSLLGGGQQVAAGSFNVVEAVALTADESGWQGITLRQLFGPAAISHGGSQVRMRFVPPVGATVGILDKVYIGHAAAAGNAWDFDGTQVQLLFSGSASVTLTGGGASIVSDAVVYALDKTKTLVAAMHYTAAAASARKKAGGATDFHSYYKVGDSAATTAPATYVDNGVNIYNIDQIEAFY